MLSDGGAHDLYTVIPGIKHENIHALTLYIYIHIYLNTMRASDFINNELHCIRTSTKPLLRQQGQ